MRAPSVLLLLLLVAAAGCAPGPDSEIVRLLLPHGDATAGRQAFIELQCSACHTVAGVSGLPAVEATEPGPDLAVSLVGQGRGAVASSLLAPAHVNVQAVELWTDWTAEERIWLGPGAAPARETDEREVSRMRDYAAVMTVRQLSDLVTFLRTAADSD